ncbi:MAG TPA: prolyl oligopeptidase family serine peptidase [Ktedonobacteraceae bacterium]|nr:prolyl oligopeptidase family serine peptidase [Ktedonobacteraceae bacterium]
MHHAQQEHTFEKQIIFPVTLHYLLYLPKEYDPQQTRRWPLVLFLHGAGERGQNLHLVAHHGPPKLVEEGHDFPFILVSPQCPAKGWWASKSTAHALAALLDDIEHNYAVDPDRVYVTGLSMGGYGTWSLATSFPRRFAAIAPICGGGNTADVCVLRSVPVWAFHGAEDHVVPLREGQGMVDALRHCGGDVRFTVYPGVEHDSWTQTYNNPEFYNWLLAQRRDTAE